MLLISNNHEAVGNPCKVCPGRSACQQNEKPVEETDNIPVMSPTQFNLYAAGLFLGPILLAIIGAVVFSRNHTTRFLGGLGGFLVGMIMSIILFKVFYRPKGKQSVYNNNVDSN